MLMGPFYILLTGPTIRTQVNKSLKRLIVAANREQIQITGDIFMTLMVKDEQGEFVSKIKWLM